ncbi:MAG: cobalamin 5'-phosphate synthase [Rhodospirillales bacterium RIFCSPLOWO2_12_FULL_58_28]|nr:MAG: cobalamin 5'-phosphate synthase [Rhodospirillales bacterium RIFCSPLOWO2_02_FULL_58_16]OHC78005.1 MAG: cobalamin 5'-phosphate synthase [Rhodospirillales bacterium RIFCSPLOWO2_12_FULL_58_28]
MPFSESIMITLSEIWLDLRVAAAFLTRIPVNLSAVEAQRPPAEAARTFPLVGAAVGAAAGLMLFLASKSGLPPPACALIALAAGVLLTGALHEDGLADVADGFGGGKTRADKLKIMRDSRIGVYGMLAIVFSIGLRASALSGISAPGTAALALIAAGAVSRAVLPVMMVIMESARKDGLGVGVGKPGSEGVTSAVLLGMALVFVFPLAEASVLALAMAVVVTAAMVWLAEVQIGGYTGDVLGAVQQAVEIVVLLVLAAAAG